VIAGAGETTEEPRDAVPELDTQGLARAAKGGDEQRFGQLYERIAPAIYTWACVRIRPAMRGQLDPQDIVQEVWCRAWKAFAHFDPEEQTFRMWIFRIAKNVTLEGFRKLQRSSSAGTPAGPTTRMFQLQNVPDTATAISRRVSRHEGVQAVLTWIEDLGEDDKKLFVLCGLEGLTYAEVSQRTQVHKETIAKRWQSLRARLGQFAVPRDLLATD
jgi:RNA polymerase sigma-70 factor, ECF subfamily